MPCMEQLTDAGQSAAYCCEPGPMHVQSMKLTKKAVPLQTLDDADQRVYQTAIEQNPGLCQAQGLFPSQAQLERQICEAFESLKSQWVS